MAKPPRRRSRKKTATKRSINPIKVVLITGIVMIVLLVSVLLIAKSAIDGWLKGDAFREFLVKRASAALHSEVGIPDLKWQGSEIYTNFITARGYEGAAFSKLELNGVRAKADGISDKAFRVPEVRVNRLDMKFGSERLPEPVAKVDTATTTPAAPSVPDWLKQYLPNRIEIDGIDISSTSIQVEDGTGQEAFALSGVRTTILPDLRTDLWELKGRGGKMSLPGQPNIEVKNLELRWKEQDLFIDRSAFGVYDGAHITGAGEIHFGEGGAMDLDFELSSLDIDKLVSEEWQERLTGTIHGPIHVTKESGEVVYEGTLNIADGEIRALPVLERVADYTRTEQFRRLVLSAARTDFKKTGERVELRNFAIQSDGLIRIEGKLDIEGENLTGDFQVGVTPGTMRWIPGAERKVFIRERDGFLWSPMTLAGTLSEPQEDLSRRLIAAAGETIIEDLPTGLLNEANKILGGGDDSGETPGAVEQGQRMLDLLTPFLKGR